MTELRTLRWTLTSTSSSLEGTDLIIQRKIERLMEKIERLERYLDKPLIVVTGATGAQVTLFETNFDRSREEASLITF